MVLYDADSHITLRDYGILIPVAPDRSARVMQELEQRFADTPPDLWKDAPGSSSINKTDLAGVHSDAYIARLFGPDRERLILEAFELIDEHGRPYRYEPESASRPLTDLVDVFLRWTARSAQAGRLALASPAQFCYNLGGGGHHGHYDFGHGFCVINDVVVAARKLQREGAARTIWIIDIDAHKGDGTAALTAGDDTVITLSIHMASGWPLDLPAVRPDGTPHPAFTPSDIDIPISAGESSLYLERLESGLETLSRYPQPDLAYVVGGVDPYEHDELPSTEDLQLTLEQLTERDRMVFDFLTDRGIPQAWLMAGGYGARAWEPYVPFLEYAIRSRLA
jgi:acetoin utilization deacetylase AcuC-like enzyme